MQNLDGKAKKVIIVYQLYDTTTYRDSSERIAAKGLHIRGAVNIAKSTKIGEAIENSLPLLEAAGNTAKAILGPMPRYVSGPCCADPAHTTNIKKPRYKDGLKRDLSEVVEV